MIEVAIAEGSDQKLSAVEAIECIAFSADLRTTFLFSAAFAVSLGSRP